MADAARTQGPAPTTSETSTSPQRAGLVLAGLILVAAVANLNLAALVFLLFPTREREAELLRQYQAEDTSPKGRLRGH